MTTCNGPSPSRHSSFDVIEKKVALTLCCARRSNLLALRQCAAVADDPRRPTISLMMAVRLCPARRRLPMASSAWPTTRTLTRLRPSVFLFLRRHLAACRRQTPRACADLKVVSMPRRDLSDAILRSVVVLGVRRWHAPKKRDPRSGQRADHR